MVRDAALAQDVSQSVFIQLARKAPTIHQANALPGWLYRVTHCQAANAVRSEQTRRRLETEATMQAQFEDNTSWKHIEPDLDEAMTALNAEEQNLVVMRFFQNQNWRDIGAAVALSEDTVQRRVGRHWTNCGPSLPRGESRFRARSLPWRFRPMRLRRLPPDLFRA